MNARTSRKRPSSVPAGYGELVQETPLRRLRAHPRRSTGGSGQELLMADRGPYDGEVGETVTATREPNFLLAHVERRALRAIARRLPGWILPDDLTALGVVSAVGICAAYALSNQNPAWLWAASALLVVHWLGDSLDGTLARVRGIGRPRYGYYLDHLVDTASTVLIGIGIGLSPFMLLAVGMLIVIAYLILSINVYLESQALGRFSIGYGRLGPTEGRLCLVAINSWLALGGDLRFSVLEVGVSALDIVALAAGCGMIALVCVRAVRNLGDLAETEPAAARRREASS